MSRPSLKRRLVKWLLILLLAPYVLAIVYIVVPPTSMFMFADMARFTLPQRGWLPLSRILPNLIKAAIVSEDSAFCSHWGFDFGAIEKSIDKAMDGKRFGGASTITQQTAKNLFLWNGRSWVRKVLEAPQALWLETVMSKRRILEIYLNIAEWGDGIYGAHAASRKYFGVSASALSLRQAALLVSALPNPKSRNPARPGAGQIAQAVLIERRVRSAGADLSCL